MNVSTWILVLVGLAVLQLVIILILVFRKRTIDLAPLQLMLNQQQQAQEQSLRRDFQDIKADSQLVAKNQQSTLNEQMQLFGNHQSQWFQAFQTQLQHLGERQEEQLSKLREATQFSINKMQVDNHNQLEKMRETVDEKLQKTLETRLGKSFERVSQHLEAVQRGLGEMQHLATGVGDLKRVLSNVKTRGVMGEMLLGNILEQILSPDQYSLNVKTIPGSSAHVEFAIKFPGKDTQEVWLPIDSKFPMDRYESLIDAYDTGTPEEIDIAQAALLKTVLAMAKDINAKYISPPHTTDFGVLFLPVEGLYAEIARHAGIMTELQNKYRIMLAGPTNLAAFLNSLQLGFKSIAIEKRSSEVWKILASVKTEFGKFGETLDKVQQKLTQASKTIDDVGVRSRAIERNLRTVETGALNEDPKKMDK